MKIKGCVIENPRQLKRGSSRPSKKSVLIEVKLWREREAENLFEDHPPELKFFKKQVAFYL